ncbi:MAG: hydroxymethylglutaryl-CoA lyase [Bacteroidetes bacterium]|nr:hydroxymethylglutaryl-CoA lyase [Bacteroidota bacterium]
MNDHLKLVECPRDAMQGWQPFIATKAKIQYLNLLLKMGFNTLDFGSFVSPKAIPQLADTVDVLNHLESSNTKLLAIVANERGAKEASQFDRIDYLGYPFSVSEEFQKRNTNASIEESLSRVEQIQNLCLKSGKELVVYLSMGFGNPYGEQWHPDLVTNWAQRLSSELDIKIIAPSDTIGCANIDSVSSLFSSLIKEIPNVEFGAHLHTVRNKAKSLIEAAYGAGCRRFDGAIKGYGGCPMATDELTGNMPTELMLEWFLENNIPTDVKHELLADAEAMADSIFH